MGPSVLHASSSVVGRAAALRRATGRADKPAYYSRGRSRKSRSEGDESCAEHDWLPDELPVARVLIDDPVRALVRQIKEGTTISSSWARAVGVAAAPSCSAASATTSCRSRHR